jgi:amyloid beta precursor protein binding protein 1
LDQYSLILLTGWANPPTVLQEVSDYAWQRSIPLFYVRSLGFYSDFSVQLPSQFPIVETHPDPSSTQDLRLLQPWRELSDYARLKTENLEGLDDHAHGHVPYLLLLFHYLDVYKASHDGKPPTSYAEKKEFKELVQSGARTKNAEGGEENFDEAVASVLKSLNSPSLAKGLQETFDAEDCRSPGVDVSYIATLIRS